MNVTLERNPTGPVNGKVGGYFCGGAPNNNYARGNEFGLNYPLIPHLYKILMYQHNNLLIYKYDMNLNLREFKNDYKLVENNVNYKSYPFNQSNTIIYKKD